MTDIAMCRGRYDAEPVPGCDRAEVAGITYMYAKEQKPGGARTCTVMVWAGEGRFAVDTSKAFSDVKVD